MAGAGLAGAFKGLEQGLLSLYQNRRKDTTVSDAIEIEKLGLDKRRVNILEAAEKRLQENAKRTAAAEKADAEISSFELKDKQMQSTFDFLENIMPEGTNIAPNRKEAAIKMAKELFGFDAGLFFVENKEKGGYNLTTKENRDTKFRERKQKADIAHQVVQDNINKLNAETSKLNALTAKIRASKPPEQKGVPTEKEARNKIFEIKKQLGQLDKMDMATSALAAAFPEFAKTDQKMTPKLRMEIEKQGRENIAYFTKFIPGAGNEKDQYPGAYMKNNKWYAIDPKDGIEKEIIPK